jgi:hypothetical protein
LGGAACRGWEGEGEPRWMWTACPRSEKVVSVVSSRSAGDKVMIRIGNIPPADLKFPPPGEFRNFPGYNTQEGLPPGTPEAKRGS